MRAVAVMDLRLFEILLPFQDAAVGVDAGRGQPGPRGVQALGELLVDPQDAGGGGRVLQQIAGDLLVERGADAQRGRLPLAVPIGVGVAVLRRVGRHDHQLVRLRILDQHGLHELAGAAQDQGSILGGTPCPA